MLNSKKKEQITDQNAEIVKASLEKAFAKGNLIKPFDEHDQIVYGPKEAMIVNRRALAYILQDTDKKYLTPEEVKSLKPEEKRKLSYARAGELVSKRVADLRETGLYNDEDINSFIDQAYEQFSWGGHNPTESVIAAVKAMGLKDNQTKQFLAQHLALRPIESTSVFEKTAMEDIALISAEFTDMNELKTLLVDALVQHVASMNEHDPNRIKTFERQDYRDAYKILGIEETQVLNRFNQILGPKV